MLCMIAQNLAKSHMSSGRPWLFIELCMSPHTSKVTKSLSVTRLRALLLSRIAPLALMGSATLPACMPSKGTIQYLYISCRNLRGLTLDSNSAM